MAVPGRNLYEQQSANRRVTVLVLCGFVAFFVLLGLGLDVYLLGFDPLQPQESPLIPLPLGTGAAFAFAAFAAARSLAAGDSSILASATATPIDESDPQFRQLINVRDEMSIAAGLPRPRLFLVPDSDPNAFATGRDPLHSSIAVTRGLVDRLNREELQGVIAHEMSHIRNYDTRLMTVVAALIGAVMLLTEFGIRALRLGGGRKRSSSSKSGGGIGGPLFVLWLIGLVFAPLISQILAMAVSRQREYLADASGAELTRNPAALASALEKIDGATDPTRLIKKGTGHLCIADPLGTAANEREGFLADLFGTHPPIRKRITALRAMAYQPG